MKHSLLVDLNTKKMSFQQKDILSNQYHEKKIFMGVTYNSKSFPDLWNEYDMQQENIY